MPCIHLLWYVHVYPPSYLKHATICLCSFLGLLLSIFMLCFHLYIATPQLLPPPLPPFPHRSEEEEDSGDADDEKGDSDTLEYHSVSIQSALKWKHSGDSLLKKFDEDLERVRASTQQKVQNHRDVAVTLHHPKFHPVTRTSFEKRLLSNIEWRWYVWGGLAIIAVIILMIIARTVWCHTNNHCKIFPPGR